MASGRSSLEPEPPQPSRHLYVKGPIFIIQVGFFNAPLPMGGSLPHLPFKEADKIPAPLFLFR